MNKAANVVLMKIYIQIKTELIKAIMERIHLLIYLMHLMDSLRHKFVSTITKTLHLKYIQYIKYKNKAKLDIDVHKNFFKRCVPLHKAFIFYVFIIYLYI